MNEKDHYLTENIVRRIEKNRGQRDKKIEFKNKTLNKKSTKELIGKKLRDNIEKIKNQITKIDWEKLASKPNYWAEKKLNPYLESNEKNPLYKDKIWLRCVYTNETLNLSDRTIAKICGLQHHKSVAYWRQKFNIPTKKETGRYIAPKAYIQLYVPKEYKHPELNPNGKKRIMRNEHIVKMEEHLMNTLSLKELSSHPCLINDENNQFYVKKGCRVHHINYRKHDNFIENLWLYENTSDHNNNNINICLSGLIKLGQIFFSEDNHKYYLNENYDYRILTRNQIAEIIKPIDFFRFDNIDLVKQEIKKIDWSDINWTINVQLNKIASSELVLNPYKDCTEDNPLYKHKEWVERIVNDSRFNLTDSRLAKLCNISYPTAYRWRHLIHKIPVERWGFKRYLHTVPNRKQIWIKVAKSYRNPFASKKVGFDYMLEHRYIIEKKLVNHPNKYHDYLVNNKYLKPECSVQHINLDSLDNKLENLYICRTHSEHEEIHLTLFDLIDDLLKKKFIIFRDGKYFLNY